MDQKERESTTRQAGLGPETAAGAPQARPAAGPSVEDLHRRPESLQALQQESAALFEEARRNPESDAALMARVFILEGLLGMEELGQLEERARARLEAREVKKKLEKPVKSDEQMRQMVYKKFFEIVGVSPAQEEFERREREGRGDEGDGEESG